MTIPDLIEQFGPYFGTFIFSILSSLIPLLNLEFYLTVVSALGPNSLNFLIMILFIATFGHMIGKAMLYVTGLGVLKIPVKNKEFYRKKIQELQLKMEKIESKSSAFIFFSGVTGLPPFYLVAFLAGTLRIPLWNFLIFGSVGRLLRLTFVLALPQLIKNSF